MCDCLATPAALAPSRRRLLGGAAALAALASSARVLAADTPLPDNRIGPDAALARLVQGNARYVAGRSTQRDFSVGRVARRPRTLSCTVSAAPSPPMSVCTQPGSMVMRVAFG